MFATSVSLGLSVLLFVGQVGAQDAASPSLQDRLSDSATWDRSATELVMQGKALAPELGKLLREACDKKDHVLCRRVLSILGRMGLDASAAYKDILEVVPHLSEANTKLGMQIGCLVCPLGSMEALEQFQGLGKPLARGRRFEWPVRLAFLEESVRCLNTLHEKVHANLDDGAEVIAKRLKRTFEDEVAQCQLIATKGKKGSRFAKTLGRRLDALIKPDSGVREDQAMNGKVSMVRPGCVSNKIRAHQVAICLTRIAPKSSHAAKANAWLLQHDTFARLRLLAARNLMATDKNLAAALPGLRRYLRQPKREVAVTCVVLDCIGMLGKAAAPARPELKKLSVSSDKRVASRARLVLKRVGS